MVARLARPEASNGTGPGQTCAMPPSTARSTPVMKELSSEARNVTAAAISSGLPLRPIGICEANWAAACSACSGVRPVVVSKAGVSIGPGLIVFTRMLRSFSSNVQAREKLRTAALLAAYVLNPGQLHTFDTQA